MRGTVNESAGYGFDNDADAALFGKLGRSVSRLARRAAPILRTASQVAAVVPGVGTGVSVGLGAAAAGADVVGGRPVGAALVASAPGVVPGGAVGAALLGQAARLGADGRAGTAVRAGSRPDPLRRVGMLNARTVARPLALGSPGTPSTLPPSGERVALALLRSPELRRLKPGALAARLGVRPHDAVMGVAAVVDASRGRRRALARAMRLEADVAGLSLDAALASYGGSSGLRRASSADAGALTTDGRYVVESGDGTYAIARKLTGDGARWRELVAANPAKKRGADGNFLTLGVGEVLNLPPAWLSDDMAARPVESVAGELADVLRALQGLYAQRYQLQEAAKKAQASGDTQQALALSSQAYALGAPIGELEARAAKLKAQVQTAPPSTPVGVGPAGGVVVGTYTAPPPATSTVAVVQKPAPGGGTTTTTTTTPAPKPATFPATASKPATTTVAVVGDAETPVIGGDELSRPPVSKSGGAGALLLLAAAAAALYS